MDDTYIYIPTKSSVFFDKGGLGVEFTYHVSI